MLTLCFYVDVAEESADKNMMELQIEALKLGLHLRLMAVEKKRAD